MTTQSESLFMMPYTQVPGGTSEGCISIDNDFSDWSSISTLFNSNGYTVKATHDNDAFYIYVNGNLEANNQFFLDADNNSSGGNEYLSSNWTQTGFNYLIQNNSLLSYTGSGSDWTWSTGTPINVQKTATEIEVEISKSLFTTNTVNFGFVTRDANWTQVGYTPNNTSATYDLSAPSDCTGNLACFDTNGDGVCDIAEHIIISSSTIEVIPNPLADKVVVNGVFDDYTIHVLDANGTLVTNYTGMTPPLTIDLNSLGTGIYFISIINNLNGQVNIHKMIKM